METGLVRNGQRLAFAPIPKNSALPPKGAVGRVRLLFAWPYLIKSAVRYKVLISGLADRWVGEEKGFSQKTSLTFSLFCRPAAYLAKLRHVRGH